MGTGGSADSQYHTRAAPGLDVGALRHDDSLCCLTGDAAVQLHRGRCSFFEGSPLLRNGKHLTVVRVKVSALHVATSHFYHDSY